jgi:hypothetical protein
MKIRLVLAALILAVATGTVGCFTFLTTAVSIALQDHDDAEPSNMCPAGRAGQQKRCPDAE